MKLMKKATTRKYIVNSDVFLTENDISFYLLGAYMTDGNIVDTKHHLSFGISSKDNDWIETIRDMVCPNKPIYSSKKSECYSLCVSDINSMNWLIEYGCTPRKSKTLEMIKNIPLQYYSDFVRGLIDGDGSISFSPYTKTKKNKVYHYMKRHIYLCSASINFLKQVKLLIPSDINCNIYNLGKQKSIINGNEVIGTVDIYRLCFNDSNAKKLATWLYYPRHKVSMRRKYETALLCM